MACSEPRCVFEVFAAYYRGIGDPERQENFLTHLTRRHWHDPRIANAATMAAAAEAGIDLPELDVDEVIGPLTAILTDPNQPAEERRSAVQGLRYFWDGESPATFFALLDGVGDPDPGVVAAIRGIPSAMCGINRPDVLPGVYERLDHPSAAVRARTALILCRYANRKLLPALDREPVLRQISRALVDADPTIRGTVVDTLHLPAPHRHFEVHAQAAGLQDRDAWVRVVSAQAMLRVWADDKEVHEERDEAWREGIREVMVEALRTGDARARARVFAYMILFPGSGPARNPFFTMACELVVRDPAPEVRNAAAAALSIASFFHPEVKALLDAGGFTVDTVAGRSARGRGA